MQIESFVMENPHKRVREDDSENKELEILERVKVNVLILVIREKSDLDLYIDKDVEAINKFAKDQTTEEHTVIIKVCFTHDMDKMNDIYQQCRGFARIIVWYSGHGSKSMNDDDKFPRIMLKNKRIMHQSELTKYLVEKSEFNMILTIFDCCNGIAFKSDKDQFVRTPRETSIFDFEGVGMISAAPPDEKALCFPEGSQFTICFINSFKTSIAETVKKVSIQVDVKPIFIGKFKFAPFYMGIPKALLSNSDLQHIDQAKFHRVMNPWLLRSSLESSPDD